MKHLSIIILSLCIFSVSNIALAHHASSPHFDRNKLVSIEGVVSEFKFVNPHAYVYLVVTNEDGVTETWNCEMNAASFLRRIGWTADILKPGTQITIQGTAARRDPLGCAFQSGTLSDGTELARDGTITAGSGEIAAAPSEVEALKEIGQSIFGNWLTPPLDFMIARSPMGVAGMAANLGPMEGTAENPLGQYTQHMTEEGLSVSLTFDLRFDDPAFSCSPGSIIRGWSEPSSTSEITQVDQQIFIKHEFMDTSRVVYMDGRDHPEEGEFGFTGHSVGRFEGDELVIETTRFDAGVLFPHPGVLHSDQLMIEERIRVSEDGSELVREYRATDPLHFSKPITGTNQWVRTDLPIEQYNCEELSGVNNQRQE